MRRWLPELRRAPVRPFVPLRPLLQCLVVPNSGVRSVPDSPLALVRVLLVRVVVAGVPVAPLALVVRLAVAARCTRRLRCVRKPLS